MLLPQARPKALGGTDARLLRGAECGIESGAFLGKRRCVHSKAVRSSARRLSHKRKERGVGLGVDSVGGRRASTEFALLVL